MKTLKYLFIALFLTIAGSRQASAVSIDPPYFSLLRVEITNQLTIASNTIPVNKSLVSKLNSALKTLDKSTNTAIAPGTKALVALTKALNKTTVSNAFDDELQFIIDIYTGDYSNAKNSLVAQLATTFPGKKHDAAQKYLDKLLAAIDGANTNSDSNLACKALALARKNLTASIKAVQKAADADAPPASVTASIARVGSSTISLSAKPPFCVFQIANTNTGSFLISANMQKGASVESINLSFVNLVAGAQTVNMTGLYTHLGFPPTAPYSSTSGTAQVTWDPVHKNLFGTFSFNMSNGSQTGTTSGSLNMYYP